MRFQLMVLCLTSVAFFPSCKTRSPSEIKGSVVQSPPGGTLAKRDLSNFDCTHFKSAHWYLLSKPVAAVIWHQYLGVRITYSEKDPSETSKFRYEFETSGLSDPTDLENLKSWWQSPGSNNKFAHMISAKTYDSCEAFLASAKRVNEAMATSRYQSAGVRVISMVIAPVPVVGGRPCARQAQTGAETWLSANSPKQCSVRTEVIPEAKWSKTSVDWTEDAFPGSKTSDTK